MLPAHPRKIAVLRAVGLGDLVTAMPALEALRAAYPSAEIVLLGRPLYRELLAERPTPVDRVEIVPPLTGIAERDGPPVSSAERARFVSRMRAEHFDIAIQLHGGGGNSNPLVLEFEAGFTAGMRAPGAPELDAWVPYRYYHNEVLRLLEVVALVRASPVTVRPRLTVMSADLRASFEVLPEAGDRLVVLHPGASDPRRRWSPERFARVASALVREGFRIAIIGQGERDVVDRVLEEMEGRADDLAERLSPRALLGVLDRAELVLGNDSGPLHLANAVGTPTVGIYWCGNLLNAEPGTRASNRPLISWRLACPECGEDCTRIACRHDASFVDDVQVADVLAEALDLIGCEERSIRDVPSRERALHLV